MPLGHRSGIEKSVSCGIVTGGEKRHDRLIFRAGLPAAVAQPHPYGKDKKQ